MQQPTKTNPWMIGSAVLVVLLLVSGCAKESTVILKDNEKQLRNTINVEGSAEKEVEPDMAETSITVQTLKKTAKEAQAENAVKVKAVLDALDAAGVKDSELETGSVSLGPHYEWDSFTQKSKITGYDASQTLNLKTKNIENIGEYIDAAVNAGATQVYGISFTLSKDLRNAEEAKILGIALADAKARASAIATAAEVTLGKPTSITQGVSFSPPIFRAMPMMAEGAKESMDVSTQVLPGKVTLNAQVSVAYEITQ